MINLSILISTIECRFELLKTLINKLKKQINENVEVVILKDNMDHSIGEKRNLLIEKCVGKFIVFIDDDDDICDNYCNLINQVVVNKQVDYIGYIMEREFDSIKQKPEYKSIYYNECFKDEYGSYRNISHTNPILRDKAKLFKFKNLNKGEDVDWCQQIKDSNIIKTEHFVNKIMYIQKYDSNKKNKKINLINEEINENFIKWIHF